MFTTTALIMAMDGAIIIVTTGDGISVGTIGATAFGNQTISIHGTTLIVTTAVTTDTIIIEDDPIHTLTDKEGEDIETQV